MWPDRDRLTFGSGGEALVFAFPRQNPPKWRQNWQAVVDQVEVTPDVAAKQVLLADFASRKGTRTLGFVNAHAMNSAVSNAAFAADVLALDYIVRDGVGVNALYRMLGVRSGLNLNGTDLIPEMLTFFAGKRIALFGTQQRIVDRVAVQLRRDLGCEVIAADGFQSDGYYLQQVGSWQPDLVVLGMGMPKQERVARQLKYGLQQDVAIICGGAILDFLSGHVPRAPRWMRYSGLEWVFRLSLEPKRLFKRYIIGNPLFLLRSAVLAVWPKAAARVPARLPERRPSAGQFGIGGPADAFVPKAPSVAELPVVELPPMTQALAAIPLPLHVAPVSGVSAFSANRPVVGRDQLFGRQAELDRLLGWVLDQNGNALVYGPRGYGKTSLVRVFGEIADSRQHVVFYASGSRRIDFETLIRSYLAEIADNGLLPPLEHDAVLTVQTVATRLAGITGGSVVLIIDEFDRIERDDTRHALIELIKDISDLTASVRFVLVGVATDVDSVLGYHPSIHRCVSSIGLSRLSAAAIEDLFVRKTAIEGLIVASTLIDTVVKLVAGSAYHAQLIGQKLVAQARRDACMVITREALDRVVDDILSETAAMDTGFAHNARAMRQPLTRARMLSLAEMALAGVDDLVALETDVEGDAFRPFCDDLVADGVLYASASVRAANGYRFTNAFMPQLLLMIQYRSLGLYAVAE